ncbi:MAG: alginate export family protein [Ferruginibacter sp.]
MKSKIMYSAFLLCAVNAHAQKILSFKPLRYDEDYSFLQKDTSNKWYKNMKYSSLSKTANSYISFGGEIRFQYFNVKNESWGDEPKDKDGYVFTRLLTHADFHAGKHFRAFAQLQSSTASGKINTSPVDENPLELHQVFIDIKTFAGAKNQLIFRIGRQELMYGSQRIMAVRDGPNNRQSFDGVKSMFTAGKYKIDLFYTQFVAARKGIFDDGLTDNVKLWGAYLVKNDLTKSLNIDAYYLGLYKKRAVFDDGRGRELRHSIGSRLWGTSRSWKYDLEGLYQFGNFSNSEIAAWTASINTSYSFVTLKLKPVIGMKTELISGDSKYEDAKLNTFNPLFPRGSYFGLAALIGPANLIDVHPSISATLAKNFDCNIDYDAFWRYSSNDAIYAPNVSIIYSGRNITDKFVGQQVAAELVYAPNIFLYFRGELTWFKTGAFLKSASPGKDILFAGFTAQLKF